MIYFLIMILFVDGEPAGNQMLGFDTDANCQHSKVMFLERAKGKGMVVNAECVGIAIPETPKFKKERDL